MFLMHQLNFPVPPQTERNQDLGTGYFIDNTMKAILTVKRTRRFNNIVFFRLNRLNIVQEAFLTTLAQISRTGAAVMLISINMTFYVPDLLYCRTKVIKRGTCSLMWSLNEMSSKELIKMH